tara:strand:- start:1138 stop:2523 length:1386 start_codon:yes stop_codon:yes gene_type:complete
MASTELERSPSSTTNRKTYTFSAWVKRSKISSGYPRIFAYDYADTDRFEFFFYNTDELQIEHVNNNSVDIDIHTTRRFRDTNAWYHIVLAVDTTQSTVADRVKLYINGVQETALTNAAGSSPTYPAQDTNTIVNYASGSKFIIGETGYSSGGANFDGLMSHIHFVDGAALAPTVFGSTDSTTGEWKINTSPSYTVGTNGFFILKDGNSVTDQSANSNNFTVAGGTLTKTEDNPSNVFATLNPLVNLGTTSRTITNGNTKFNTSTTAWGNILSTLAFPSGKFYAEFQFTALQSSNGYGGMGITDATESYTSNDSLNNHSSTSAGVTGDYRSGQSNIKSAGSTVTSNIGNFSNGDIIGLAADMDNKALYIHKNGTYYQISSVTGVPTSGASKTGAVTIPATCVDCMFWAASYTSDATITANFGNGYFGTTAVSSAGANASNLGIFEYDVPSGYTALCTKGLNL